MMARLLGTLSLLAVAVSSGCCTMPCGPCGPAGPRMACLCLPCLPKPIVWNGCCNECGPCQGESCDGYCGGGGCGPLGHAGLFPWLRGTLACGRGCGEVYCDEWYSDPPDCCDPCDQCHGCFTGPGGGPCCLGPAQRVLAAIHGYKYCAAPNCGPWRPIFGHCLPFGGGGCGCGGAGCSSCGGGAHGADIYYGGPAPMHGEVITEGESILNENWNQPRAKPVPGKPIHNAQQPTPSQIGQRPMSRQSAPGQLVSRPVSGRLPVGNGVRPASY